MTSLIRRFRAFALVLIAPLALAACGVNAIPTKEEKAKAQWAEVQNQYQRRADLIPNLVATVKGYAAQESSVLIGVSQARAGALQVRSDAGITTDPAAFQRYAAAQNNLSLALAPMRVLQENYPDLKSNENFMALQSQLEGTENRVTIARRDYNEAVRDFNTTLRTFPQVIWAKTMYSSSKPMELFQATATAQSAPTVDFSPTTPAAAPPPGAAPGSPPPK
ncbi:MAG: LemA family protein [Alphaproteobacteria bacterium]|nr:LemA family protein [Alphaproteobacteria bacterium]MBU1515111.1 LemA family protein [Alphaproteobacteria bacterium]MBU2093469.1 LemA family protein [Alphaproteobacteria bacterium]MBU2152317.1 LemA family protein [Alphaproteobacteria bacterium]MBU2308131.1 LemA family protein [Alphaproteobacteria bacterium]